MRSKNPLHLIIILLLPLILIFTSACLTAAIEPEKAAVPASAAGDAAEDADVTEAPAVTTEAAEDAGPVAAEEPAVLFELSIELAMPKVPLSAPEPVLDRKSALPLPPRRKAGARTPGPVVKQHSGQAAEPLSVLEPEDDSSEMEYSPQPLIEAAAETEEESFLSVLFEPENHSAPAAESDAESATPPDVEPDAAAAEPEPIPVAVVAEPAAPPDAEADEIIKSPAGEVLTIVLDGEGWILDRMMSSDGSEAADIRFNGREYRGGQTVFSFYPFRENVFIIQFRLINYSSGSAEARTVRVDASAAETLEEPETADRRVDDTLTPGPAEHTEALPAIGAVEYAAEDEPPQRESVLPAGGEAPDDVPALVEYAEALAAAGRCADAASVLEEKLGLVSWTEADRLYYSLAELYQNCSAIRDERKAVKYYRHIIDYYPVSNYWTLSKERLNLLERNFIHIR